MFSSGSCGGYDPSWERTGREHARTAMNWRKRVSFIFHILGTMNDEKVGYRRETGLARKEWERTVYSLDKAAKNVT